MLLRSRYIMITRYDNIIKVADTAAGVSVVGAVTSHMALANDIAQFLAALVAIMTGVMATAFHYERWKALRAERVKEEEEIEE